MQGCGCLIALFLLYLIGCSGPSSRSHPPDSSYSSGSTRPVGNDPDLQKEGDVKVVVHHYDSQGNIVFEVDTVRRR